MCWHKVALPSAQVLLVPSAFTKKTGEAHWELLLRARAVETQCYVHSISSSYCSLDLKLTECK
jgi:predicted amidohydrolase